MLTNFFIFHCLEACGRYDDVLSTVSDGTQKTMTSELVENFQMIVNWVKQERKIVCGQKMQLLPRISKRLKLNVHLSYRLSIVYPCGKTVARQFSFNTPSPYYRKYNRFCLRLHRRRNKHLNNFFHSSISI